MRGVGKHAETSTGLRSCTDTAPYTFIEQKGTSMSRITRTVALTVVMPIALLGGVAMASSASADPDPKVLVCKFVSTPGTTTERLQTGQNPILVSANSTSGAMVGQTFNDAQGASLVLAVATKGQTTTTLTCPQTVVVNPPVVKPPVVNPPAVKPPVVNPPAVNPPAGLPKSGPPHTGGVGDINPLNGLIALGLLTAGAGVSLSLRRKAGVNRA